MLSRQVSLLHNIVELVRAFRGMVRERIHGTAAIGAAQLEERDNGMVMKLVQATSLVTVLVGHLSSWYTNRSNDVSKLAKCAFEALRSLSLVALEICDGMHALAEEIKNSHQIAQQDGEATATGRMHGGHDRSSKRRPGFATEMRKKRHRGQRHSARGVRRYVPRIILHVERLSAAAKQLSQDIGVNFRPPGERCTLAALPSKVVLGAGVGRWRQEVASDMDDAVGERHEDDSFGAGLDADGEASQAERDESVDEDECSEQSDADSGGSDVDSWLSGGGKFRARRPRADEGDMEEGKPAAIGGETVVVSFRGAES
jgi:hypothetical protein